MRHLVLLIFSLFVTPLLAQTYLEGTYYNTSPMEYSESYIFKKDGTFKYYFSDDLFQLTYGEGNYKIFKNKVLELNFTKFNRIEFEKQYKNNLEVITSKSFSDSVNFRIKIVDKSDNAPLHGTIVSILDSNRQKFYPNIIYEADESGVAEFVLSKELYPILIKISYIGFDDYIFRPQKSVNYNIVLEFNPKSIWSFSYINPGTNESYEFEFNSEKSFNIKLNGSSYWETFEKTENNSNDK